MDCIYYEAVETHMKRYQSKIKGKLSKFTFDKVKMSDKSDMICMVLDYSPILKEEKRTFGTIFLTKTSIK